MVSLIILASLMPSFILLIGAILILFMNDRINRKLLSSFIILLAFIMNTMLLGFYIGYGLIEREFYLNLTSGTFIISEIILLLGLIVNLFSKEEIVNIVNENLFDGIILIILLGMIGTTISSNLLVIVSWFILVIVLIGIIFYFGDYPKEFRLLKNYFLGVGISIILLFSASYLIYLEFGTLILTEIKLLEMSGINNVIISLLLLFGIGIPCGLFPFSIYHLKNYYHDSSYTNLFLFSIFSYVNIFVLIRVLNIFTFNLIFNGLFLMVISGIGLIISLIYVLTELFTSLDGDTFSIKKLFGFSISADFNMFLLFASFLVFLGPLEMTNSYMNILIFYLLMVISIKALIFYTFFPIMRETHDDNLKLLGQFQEKYKSFGNILLIAALILSLPLSILSFIAFPSIFSTEGIIEMSLYSLLSFLIIVLYIIYLSITLIFISITRVQIYFSDKPRYIERESVKNISANHYLPIIIIFIIIGLLNIMFLLGNNIFYLIFKSFLIIID